MDDFKPEERVGEDAPPKEGLLSRISGSISTAIKARPRGREEPVYDTVVFLLALIFSRTHLLLGAHPLGIALVAALPARVWMATLGAVVGALTLGSGGVLYAMVTVITVFLRIIVSGGDKRRSADKAAPPSGESAGAVFFREGLPLRMSAALISGFVAAVYEALLGGINMTVVLYGAAMVLLPPIAVLGFSGLFESGMSVRRILFDNTAVFKERVPKAERYARIYFQCSALCTLFLIGFALGGYELFGISASYIFAGFVTLFASRRFGSLRGAAVGFFSLLGISSVGAVAFALLGITAGTLYRMGIPYAIAGGGGALVAWCFYSEGLEGVLSVLPEYFLASLLVFPFLKRIPEAKTEGEAERTVKEASDMVGTVALAYKNRYSGSVDALEGGLAGVSEVLEEYNKKLTRPRLSELCELAGECMDRYCRTCSGYESCLDHHRDIPPNMLENLSTILYNNGCIRAEDVVGMPDFCNMAQGFAETVNRAYAMLTEDRYREGKRNSSPEDIGVVARLLSEARARDVGEKRVNDALSARVCEVLSDYGILDGVCRIFGQRNLHIIISGEDADGSKITSPELHHRIEELCERRLGAPEYFRRGSMALMECSCIPRFSVEYATLGVAGRREAVSGDTAKGFTTSGGYFCSLISDGMGSGQEAREVSGLVTELLFRALDFGEPSVNLLRLVNGALRAGNNECSATVDLFSLDLYSGAAAFHKSGAALSYIKRADSIFRIASNTAPLGLMKTPDVERIKVEVQTGDLVVMLSDGICDNSQDAPWLLELLARTPYRTAADLAEKIISAAKAALPLDDDITVSVMKIGETK